MKMILCEARHTHPEIEGLPAIFTGDIDPMNFDALLDRAAEVCCLPDEEGLDLYVTGLTPALIAVINVCIVRQTRLSLWHYDRATDSYKEQTTHVRYWHAYMYDAGIVHE